MFKSVGSVYYFRPDIYHEMLPLELYEIVAGTRLAFER
jgi:hypothetical protein